MYTYIELAGAVGIFHFKTADIVLHQQRYATKVRVCTDPGDITLFEGCSWYAGRRLTEPLERGRNCKKPWVM